MTLQGGVAAPRRASVPNRSQTPLWTPPPSALDNLEMLLLGAYRPLTGFLGQQDAASVLADGRLMDGTPWPVPVVLEVPVDMAAAASAAGALRLADEEGAPVGQVSVLEVWPLPNGNRAVAGPVRALGLLSRGPYPALRRVADGSSLARGALLAVPLERAPDHRFLAAIQTCALDLEAEVLLMPLVGFGRGADLDPAALVRASLGIARLAGPGTYVLPVPLPGLGDHEAEHQLLSLVAAAYGAAYVVGPDTPTAGAVSIPLPGPLSDATVDPTYPAPVEHELRRTTRYGQPGNRRGLVVLFTGLSGSGKSTIARALHQALLERTDRTVSLLDGDVVRRMLSSELGFSREHRELNVRRIGFVAAEIARHGGIAVCAPIAPYADTRAEFRSMVEAVGQLLLVHVSTPLHVCEMRDRKGLYARARAGQLREFTGISDPYDEPTDADVRIDTSTTDLNESVKRILARLQDRDLVELEDFEVPWWI